jgi:hypothetical protein
MRKVVVRAYFKVLSQHLPGMAGNLYFDPLVLCFLQEQGGGLHAS